MNIIKILLISFMLISGSVFTGCSQNVLKLIEKEKYDKAKTKIISREEKLKKREQKISGMNERREDRLNLNFVKVYIQYSKLYNNKTYYGYSPNSAYYYIKKAKKRYNLLSYKKREKIKNKKYYSILFINRDIRKISQNAFDIATEKHTVHSYQHFIDYYKPEDCGHLIDSAIIERNLIAFNYAKQINTEASYQDFINTYPNATQVEWAIKRSDKVGLDNAIKRGTTTAIQDWRRKYKRQYFRTKADSLYDRYQIHEETDGTLNGYIYFAENYKNNQFLNEIHTHIKLSLEYKTFNMKDYISVLNLYLDDANNKYLDNSYLDTILEVIIKRNLTVNNIDFKELNLYFDSTFINSPYEQVIIVNNIPNDITYSYFLETYENANIWKNNEYLIPSEIEFNISQEIKLIFRFLKTKNELEFTKSKTEFKKNRVKLVRSKPNEKLTYPTFYLYNKKALGIESIQYNNSNVITNRALSEFLIRNKNSSWKRKEIK